MSIQDYHYFMLFDNYAYCDFDLPCRINDNLSFIDQVEVILDNMYPGEADYVYPGYSIEGFSMNHQHLGLREVGGINDETFNNEFFTFLLALRLYKPVHYSIVSSFKYGSDNSLNHFARHKYITPWSLPITISVSDCSMINEILIRVKQILSDKSISRIKNAINIFTHITNGYVNSLQLATSGIFVALESIYKPSLGQGNYRSKLAMRIEAFLSNYDFGYHVTSFIEKRYHDTRNEIMHGEYDIVPWNCVPDAERNSVAMSTFGLLLETLRLSILNFISLDDNLISSHTQISNNSEMDEFFSYNNSVLRYSVGQRSYLILHENGDILPTS